MSDLEKNINDAADDVKDAAQDVASDVANAADKAADKAGDALNNAADTVGGAAKGAAGAVSGAASNLSGAVNNAGSNNKLFGALTYPIPLFGILALVSDSMKNDPVLRKHSVQSLALGVALFVVSLVLGFIPLVGCLVPFLWLITLYYAYQAYQGKDVNIPVITDFCKNQGWF